MHRCFIETSWIDEWMGNEQAALPEEVAHRLLKVLRVKEHELIGLFDGQGRQVSGTIASFSRPLRLKEASLYEEKASNTKLILLQAALEESKIIETLKRGTEFGVDRFVIFGAQYSAPFILDKLKKRSSRLLGIVIDAARQSGRLFVPELIFANSLLEALDSQVPRPHLGFFGDIAAKELLSKVLNQGVNTAVDALIAVGPEGGLSSKEKDELLQAGFHGVRWAPYVMRTELAALAAVSLINAFWGRA